MIKRLLLISMLASLVGCTSSTQVKVPQWFLTPTSHTGEKLYGVGQGLSKKVAKQKAIEDIVEYISVQVKTQSVSSQTLSLGKLSRSYQDTTKLSSSTIKLTKITEENAAQQGHDFYMQVSVNRYDLIMSLKKKAAEYQAQIQLAISTAKSLSRLEAVLLLNKKQAVAKAFAELIPIISALEPTYDSKQQESTVTHFIHYRNQLVNNFSVNINAKPALTPIVEAIQNYLSEQGIVSQKKQADLTIAINEKTIKQTLYGSEHAKMTLSLKLQNSQKKTFKNEFINQSASSVTSFNVAKSQAINALSKKINDSSTIKSLGF